jgi:hypothetical protein
MINDEQPVNLFLAWLKYPRFRPFEKVTQCHDFIHLRNVLLAGRMQNERLSVAGYLEVSVMFFRDIAHFSQKSMDIAPFQIVRDRVLKDSVESALMGAG